MSNFDHFVGTRAVAAGQAFDTRALCDYLGKHLEGWYDLMAAVDKLGHLLDLPQFSLARLRPLRLRRLRASQAREAVHQHQATDGTR